jgi:hypothetical protein
MKLQFDDMEIDIIEIARRTRGYRGGPGWFWQDTRLPPIGPFKSVPAALGDIISQLESGKLAATLEAYYERRRAVGYGSPLDD